MDDAQFLEFSKKFLQASAGLVASGNTLTANINDYSFNSSYPEFRTRTKANQARMMQLLSKMAAFSGFSDKFAHQFLADASIQGNKAILAEKFIHFNEFASTLCDKTSRMVETLERSVDNPQSYTANALSSHPTLFAGAASKASELKNGGEFVSSHDQSSETSLVRQWNKASYLSTPSSSPTPPELSNNDDHFASKRTSIESDENMYKIYISEAFLCKTSSVDLGSFITHVPPPLAFKSKKQLVNDFGKIYKPAGKYSYAKQFLGHTRIKTEKLFKFDTLIDNDRSSFVPNIQSIRYAKQDPSYSLEDLECFVYAHADPAIYLPSFLVDLIDRAIVGKVKQAVSKVAPNLLPIFNDISPDTYVSYQHPFETEIATLINRSKTGQMMRQCSDELALKQNDLDKTPFFVIEDVAMLDALIDMIENPANYHLGPITEIAVDLEAHNIHSFQGFCCLIQISTRYFDAIIDVLPLHNEIYKLGRIFASPNIVKVLHGSTSDINWLQNDFGIYIVNLFDTYVASEILGFPGLSLNFLLMEYCGVDNTSKKKKFQTSDWRVRPLSEEQLVYAREDTHYLLYIYDMIRQSLMLKSKHNGLSDMMALTRLAEEKSADLSLTSYKRSTWTHHTFIKNILFMKRKKAFAKTPLTDLQLSMFKVLYDIRDFIARKLDESIGTVISYHKMYSLIQKYPNSKESFLQASTYVLPEFAEFIPAIVAIFNALYTAFDYRKENQHTLIASVFDTIGNNDYLPNTLDCYGAEKKKIMSIDAIQQQAHEAPGAHESIKSAGVHGPNAIQQNKSNFSVASGLSESGFQMPCDLLYKPRVVSSPLLMVDEIEKLANLLAEPSKEPAVSSRNARLGQLIYQFIENMDKHSYDEYKKEKIEFIESMVTSSFLQTQPASMGPESQDEADTMEAGDLACSEKARLNKELGVKRLQEQLALAKHEAKEKIYEQKNFVLSTSLPEVITISKLASNLPTTPLSLKTDPTFNSLEIDATTAAAKDNANANATGYMSKNKKRKLKISEISELVQNENAGRKRTLPFEEHLGGDAVQGELCQPDYLNQQIFSQAAIEHNSQSGRASKKAKKNATFVEYKKSFNPYAEIKTAEFKPVPVLSSKYQDPKTASFVPKK